MDFTVTADAGLVTLSCSPCDDNGFDGKLKFFLGTPEALALAANLRETVAEIERVGPQPISAEAIEKWLSGPFIQYGLTDK